MHALLRQSFRIPRCDLRSAAEFSKRALGGYDNGHTKQASFEHGVRQIDLAVEVVDGKHNDRSAGEQCRQILHFSCETNPVSERSKLLRKPALDVLRANGLGAASKHEGSVGKVAENGRNSSSDGTSARRELKIAGIHEQRAETGHASCTSRGLPCVRIAGKVGDRRGNNPQVLLGNTGGGERVGGVARQGHHAIAEQKPLHAIERQRPGGNGLNDRHGAKASQKGASAGRQRVGSEHEVPKLVAAIGGEVSEDADVIA